MFSIILVANLLCSWLSTTSFIYQFMYCLIDLFKEHNIVCMLMQVNYLRLVYAYMNQSCVYIPISPFYPNMHGPSWAHVCNVFIAHDQNFFWKIFLNLFLIPLYCKRCKHRIPCKRSHVHFNVRTSKGHIP